jgi:hypothetical protein
MPEVQTVYKGAIDGHGGYLIDDMAELDLDEAEFTKKLKYSLPKWIEEGVRSV